MTITDNRDLAERIRELEAQVEALRRHVMTFKRPICKECGARHWIMDGHESGTEEMTP